jgi:hypothetical protein
VTLLGWKYIGRNSCSGCDNEWDRLFLPIADKKHGNIVMFQPICERCRAKYDLAVECGKCRSPMMKVTSREGVKYDCSVCPPKATGTLHEARSGRYL